MLIEIVIVAVENICALCVYDEIFSNNDTQNISEWEEIRNHAFVSFKTIFFGKKTTALLFFIYNQL